MFLQLAFFLFFDVFLAFFLDCWLCNLVQVRVLRMTIYFIGHDDFFSCIGILRDFVHLMVCVYDDFV